MYIIYALKNKYNPKIYIGQTKQTLKQRWGGGHGYRDCILIERAIEKYGANSFYYDVLTVCETLDVADYWEKYFISHFDTCNPIIGYNISIGGMGRVGVPHTDETKQKISLTKTGHSEANIGSFQTGNVPWHAGKNNVYSDETLQAMSNAKIGSIPWNKGVECPDDVKQKISDSLTGRPGHNKGRKWSEETLQKKSKAMFGKTWKLINGKRIWSSKDVEKK